MSRLFITLSLSPSSILNCFVNFPSENCKRPYPFVATQRFLFLSTPISRIPDPGKLSAAVVLIIELGSNLTAPEPLLSVNQYIPSFERLIIPPTLSSKSYPAVLGSSLTKVLPLYLKTPPSVEIIAFPVSSK